MMTSQPGSWGHDFRSHREIVEAVQIVYSQQFEVWSLFQYSIQHASLGFYK